ncbi:hypothetical protein [Halorubrum lipolyticum]|uniref:hypothetical protein n=1 Tax=Halorubrum lipolyticum TaxID=368624 RepID=UPI000A851166|nr:hypothetical protein [Halorubrum lipolyticum]
MFIQPTGGEAAERYPQSEPTVGNGSTSALRHRRRHRGDFDGGLEVTDDVA